MAIRIIPFEEPSLTANRLNITKKSNETGDIPLKYTDKLNTPVYSNLMIPAGSFEYGNEEIEYDGIELDTILFSVSRNKIFTETPLINSIGGGSVIEVSNNGFFNISCSGSINSMQADVFPQELLETLEKICSVPRNIKIVSKYLNTLGITEIFIQSESFSQIRGTNSDINFSFNARSVKPLEARLSR